MSAPILLFGLPRSGTTWVGKLFDSHPDTLYRHEPDSVDPMRMPLFTDAAAVSRYGEEVKRFVSSLPLCRDPEVVGKQPLFAKSYHSAAALVAYRASVVAAKAVSRLHRHFPCVYRPTGRSPRVRLVWKSIESSGRLGLFVNLLPEARAVYLLRHPCGYVASHLRGAAQDRFAGADAKTSPTWLLERLLRNPSAQCHRANVGDVHHLAPEERLAWLWVLTQERVLADVATHQRVLVVRYEDICAEPLAATKEMFQFADLAWSIQTERFVHASTESADTGYYSVFKHPHAVAERWRLELKPAVQLRVLRILGASSMTRYYGTAPGRGTQPAAEATA